MLKPCSVVLPAGSLLSIDGPLLAGGRSIYRFHLDTPIPFTQSFKATITRGSANNLSSIAYWYQSEPHAAPPPLPPVEHRLPTLQPVGGPGNAAGGPARVAETVTDRPSQHASHKGDDRSLGQHQMRESVIRLMMLIMHQR